ncbi:MAG: response regulator [FCB group bacterium]|jgi:two-component system chemotaxis response regulator CheY|nr:response regulator [FCB group bacterium]
MKNILVVDDSPVVRSFHMNILKTAGFTADGASDGVEALEKALVKHYDLILCDINMPNMDGLTFIKKYREEERETPVIIITTQEEAIHWQKGYEVGANIYIVKPAKPQKLVMHISMLLGMANA